MADIYPLFLVEFPLVPLFPKENILVPLSFRRHHNREQEDTTPFPSCKMFHNFLHFVVEHGTIMNPLPENNKGADKSVPCAYLLFCAIKRHK